jgi:hypothetical protein
MVEEWIRVYFSFPLPKVDGKKMNEKEVNDFAEKLIEIINESYIEGFISTGRSPHIFIGDTDFEKAKKTMPFTWKYKRDALWKATGETNNGIIIYPTRNYLVNGELIKEGKEISLTLEELGFLRPAIIYANNNLSKFLGIPEARLMRQEVGEPNVLTKNGSISLGANFLLIEYDIRDRLEHYNKNPNQDKISFGAPYPVELKELIRQMKDVYHSYKDVKKAKGLEKWIIAAEDVLRECKPVGFLGKIFN